MLIHPWDAASDAEWRAWLADGHDFGQLVAVDDDYRPLIAAVHFQFGRDADGADVARFHLARPNPIGAVLEKRPSVVLTVLDDYAFIPGYWRPPVGVAPEHGVPTSYYATVQLYGEATLIDDPEAKAELLRAQLAHFQPEGGQAPIAADAAPYGRMLAGIRGVELRVTEVRGKFKYGDKVGDAEQLPVAEHLRQRHAGRDVQAREQQLRRNVTQPHPNS